MLSATLWFLQFAVVIYDIACSVLAVIAERVSVGFIVVYIDGSVLYSVTGWWALSLDSRILYHRHTRNIGALPNFQFALSRVETPYFSLLSDDDLLLPGFYSTALREFDRYPEAGFVVLDVLHQDHWGDLVRESSMRPSAEGCHRPFDGLRDMVRYWPTTWTGIVFRREALSKLETIDLETGAPSDLDFVLRAALYYPFVIRHQPGAVFTRTSVVFSQQQWARVGSYWPQWSKLVSNIADAPILPLPLKEATRRGLLEMLAQWLKTLGLAAVIRRDTHEALQAAQILRDHTNSWSAALILRTMAGLSSTVPPVRWTLLGMFRFRDLARHLWRRTLNDYGSLRSDPKLWSSSIEA